MAPEIVLWETNRDLKEVAALWGEAVPDVRTDLAGLPDAAEPVAVIEAPATGGRGRVLAAALFLPARLLRGQRCSLARLAVASRDDAEHAIALVAWAEARAAAERAPRLEIVERHAPGLPAALAERGYGLVDALIRMRRSAARPVPVLPAGFTECTLAEAGIDAWVEVANTSFASVPFSAPARRDEYAREAADPGFDAGLIRLVVDGTGPVAYLHGTLSSAGIGEVRAIGVVPRAQGRGLGRWVLRRCEQLLDEHAPSEVILRVADSNQPARDLYVREGYVETARHRAWERAP